MSFNKIPTVSSMMCFILQLFVSIPTYCNKGPTICPCLFVCFSNPNGDFQQFSGTPRLDHSSSETHSDLGDPSCFKKKTKTSVISTTFIYPLVNQHKYGTSPCSMEKSTMNSHFQQLCEITRGYINHIQIYYPQIIHRLSKAPVGIAIFNPLPIRPMGTQDESTISRRCYEGGSPCAKLTCTTVSTVQLGVVKNQSLQKI